MDNFKAVYKILSTLEKAMDCPAFDVSQIDAEHHPSGLTFSPGDLSLYIKRPNMKMLTAVGNDGTVYAIERTQTTDEIAIHDFEYALEQAIEQTQTKDEVFAALKRFFDEVQDHGVRYHTGEN